MTMSIRRNLQGPYTPGVPSPYAMHVHPFPTRFHGPIYTRPVFGFPRMAQPQTVPGPGNSIDGLGAYYASSSGSLGSVDAGNGIFKPGGYGGGVFDGNLSGLGSEAQDYPWGVKSQKTLELQQATNVSLKQQGYCAIVEDGKLGPATCGARAQLSIDNAGRVLYALPSTCPNDASQMTAPRKTSAGCTGPSLPVASKPPTTAVTTASMSPSFSSGMSPSTKKALAFGVGGIAAIAAIYMIKKRK